MKIYLYDKRIRPFQPSEWENDYLKLTINVVRMFTQDVFIESFSLVVLMGGFM